MLIEKLITEISVTHDPLLKECLNEIIRLTAMNLELESELLARGYVDAINDIKEHPLTLVV
jgi:hypothetical protein